MASVPLPLDAEEQSEERALSPGWTYGTAAVVALASVLRQPYLVLLALCLLLALLCAELWRRFALTGLSYTRTLQPRVAAWGDEVELASRVVNRKALPLPWLSLEEDLPAALPVLNGLIVHSHVSGRHVLSAALDLAPYQAITRRYRLRCAARGYHQIGPTTLRTGDPFGLVVQRLLLSQRDYLLVYPRIVPLDLLGLPATNPLGEARSRQRLHDDPALLAGTRAYVYGDSPRRMHWKATARMGTLQVKTFDHSATLDVLIALDVSTIEPGTWACNVALLELAICSAASLAVALLEAGRPVGLVTNGFPAGLSEEARLPTGRSHRQAPALLEMFARLGPWAWRPLSDTLAADLGAIPPGATVAVVTALLTPDLAEVLAAYRAAGYAVGLFLLGDQASIDLPGIPVQYLGGEERWHELERMALPSSGADADQGRRSAPPGR